MDRQQETHPDGGNGQTRNAASHRQQQAFRQQLPHETSASGADRGPNGEFTPPLDGPNQQQVGHVRAGDQQNHSDRAQ